MKPEVSICAAIYNTEEKFLRAMAESVTADKDRRIEIILGDDCSDKPHVEKICREYGQKDDRIKYIRAEKNGGVSAMRNIMIEKSCGKFLTFVDGDDVVTPDYVQKIINASGKNFDIVMFCIQSFYGDVPEIHNKNVEIVKLPRGAGKEFSVACITGAPYRAEMYGIKNTTPSSVCLELYRRDFLIENNLKFTVGIKKSQDTVFNSQAFYYCKILGYTADVLYLYRQNPKSVCSRYSADLDKTFAKCFECDKINAQTLYPDDKDVMQKLYKYKVIWNIVENFRLNIFHRDNPKPRKMRKLDFINFVNGEPYKTFFENFDFNSYDWRERKLILRLAKNKNFAVLNFMYKHPVRFKIYGGITNRIDKLFKR